MEYRVGAKKVDVSKAFMVERNWDDYNAHVKGSKQSVAQVDGEASALERIR